jgi:hypothetical protein
VREREREYYINITQVASSLSSSPPAAQPDARATLKGALGELIVKGNALPAAQVSFKINFKAY